MRQKPIPKQFRDDVTQAILQRRTYPSPRQLYSELGSNRRYYDAFVIMTAFNEQSGKIWRKDEKPTLRHPYETVYRPKARKNDPDNPSGYELSGDEIIYGLLHDLGEDVGGSLGKAMILNNALGRVFCDFHKVEFNLNLLTDYRDMVWNKKQEHIKKAISSGVPFDEIADSTIKPLFSDKEGHDLHDYLMDKKEIDYEYLNLANLLLDFRTSLTGIWERRHKEWGNHLKLNRLSEEELEGMISTLLESEKRIRDIPEREHISPDRIPEKYLEIYNEMRKIILDDSYMEIDQRLVTDLEGSPYPVKIRKTLYYNFIDEIFRKANHEGYPVKTKLSDNIDNVKNLPYPSSLTSMIRIFRKAKATVRTSIRYQKEPKWKEKNDPDGGIWNATGFLYRNLDAAISMRSSYLDDMAVYDTMEMQNQEKIRLLRKQLDEFRELF